MTEQRKDWFGRNWKWFVPVMCLAMLLMFGGFFAALFLGIETMLKSSRPYQKAVTAAKADPRVIAVLGTPITEGWFTIGNVSVNHSTGQGTTGRADMAIPIQGPKEKGTIYVVASETASKWSFSKMVVHVTKTDEDIDLTETNKEIPVFDLPSKKN